MSGFSMTSIWQDYIDTVKNKFNVRERNVWADWSGKGTKLIAKNRFQLTMFWYGSYEV